MRSTAPANEISGFCATGVFPSDQSVIQLPTLENKDELEEGNTIPMNMVHQSMCDQRQKWYGSTVMRYLFMLFIYLSSQIHPSSIYVQ